MVFRTEEVDRKAEIIGAGVLGYVVLSCALGQEWWTDNHSCSNCAFFTYMKWM